MRKKIVTMLVLMFLTININATTVNIADILDFKGSIIIDNSCMEIYKFPYTEKEHYYIVGYKTNEKGFFRENFIFEKEENKVTKKSLKNLNEKQLCYERR